MTTKETLSEPIDAVRKQTEAVKRSYQDYLNNPFEAKHVHVLRANIRKLRALLNFLKPTIDPALYQELQSHLREAGRGLSPLRDLDVLHVFCQDFAVKEPDLSDNYQALFNYLGILRRREQRKTFNKTNSQHFDNMLKSIDILLSDKQILQTKHWPQYIDKRLAKKQDKLENLSKHVDEMPYEALHDTRKKAKKLRYAASLLKRSTEQMLKKIIKSAKHIQADLGKETDSHVIERLLSDLSEKAPDEAVQAILLLIQKQLKLS